MATRKPITYFDDFLGPNPNAFLSNFYRQSVVYQGVRYKTSEHAFAAAKAHFQEDHDAIAACKTPGDAKSLGRSIRLRPDWEQVKVRVMTEICLEKFAPGTKLRRKLCETSGRKLVEGNNWGDRFWGVVNGKGQNYLGRILMAIRDGDENLAEFLK